MTTYLVTGGCGFIGSHLCHALIAAGHAVRVLDDLSSGFRRNLPQAATLIEGDVADPVAASAALDGTAGCFHLAAVASVERGVRNWLGTHRANLTGTITLLELIRRAPVPFVYASSAAVYGDYDRLPLTEDAPVRPLSAYGADKLGCELHARVATLSYGIPTVGLRFFNVYGPRQDPGSPYSGVISVFCDRLSRGQPVDVFGDGTQMRDFVYVADAVGALLAAMAVQPADAPVFNVCTGQATSVVTLAEAIGALCGTRPQIRFHPRRTSELRHSLGSTDRARATLALPDPTPLASGLSATLAWLTASRTVAAAQ